MSANKKLGQKWIFNWFIGFNEIPTSEDSLTYMKSVLFCAKADGVLSAEEREWVLGFCASWGVEDWVIEELKTYEAKVNPEEIEKAMTVAVTDYGIKFVAPNSHMVVSNL